jgi:alanine racemase
VPEGIELRTAGNIQAPIMVMGAVNSVDEMQAMAALAVAAHPGDGLSKRSCFLGCVV